MRLTINAGSSSLKTAFFENKKLLFRINYDFSLKKKIQKGILNKEESFKGSLKDALNNLYFFIKKNNFNIDFVAHRVVHGGEYFKGPVIINDKVKEKISLLSEFAPLHNKFNLLAINFFDKKNYLNIALFDTAYYQSLEEETFLYGIPYKLYKKYKIRKYGFHGLNHSFLTKKALKEGYKRVITCHLGNGSSITASINGKAIDTTMGFSPNDGLIMGSRSGALDPEIVIYLLRLMKDPDKVDYLLNKKSGLLGIAHYSDMRKIRESELKGNKEANLALRMLSLRIKKSIASFFPLLKNVEAIIFSGGIGESAYYLRKESLKGFKDIIIDNNKNKCLIEGKEGLISKKNSLIKVFVWSANEELEMIEESDKLLKKLH